MACFDGKCCIYSAVGVAEPKSLGFRGEQVPKDYKEQSIQYLVLSFAERVRRQVQLLLICRRKGFGVVLQ